MQIKKFKKDGQCIKMDLEQFIIQVRIYFIILILYFLYLMIGQIDQNFVCLICTQLADNAVQTYCCGQIMCDACVNDLTAKGHQICPNCRQKLEVKPSVLARRMISSIKVSCEQCEQKFPQKQMKQHKKKCSKRIIICKDCLKQIKVGIITQHMKEAHYQKLKQLCEQYQLGLQLEPILSKITSCSDRIVSSKIKNQKGLQSHLGTTGKYYCGRQKSLIGKCLCCDGNCGPTNGQNCDDCMQMDVKRFSLPKGFLINTAGIVCKADEGTIAYYCGRMYGRQFCSKVVPCTDCEKMSNAIKLGRYKKLI